MKSENATHLELQSRILTSALRHSWIEGDKDGTNVALNILYRLYPDLLPIHQRESTDNYYDLLQVDCDVSESAIHTAYLRVVRKFLREKPKQVDAQKDFDRLLNAGLTLRKSRLRLSHDFVVLKDLLVESQNSEHRRDPELACLPMLIELLRLGQFIRQPEVEALMSQMELYPNVPLPELILHCGYATERELKILNLAEYLLNSGKITAGQFAVAMYDMRSQQWDIGDDFLPPGWGGLDTSRVPKHPLPNSWTGGIALPLPDPDEPQG